MSDAVIFLAEMKYWLNLHDINLLSKNIMKKLIGSLLMSCLVVLSASAQESKGQTLETDPGLLTFRGEVRIDYQRDWQDSHVVKNNTGFEGKYVNIRVDGRIAEGLTYSWRQRLNKHHGDGSFFDATDWVYIDYRLGAWSFSGGKQVVAIGGWEYDRAPIDLYGCSVFWNNIPCYEIGASVAWHPTGSDKLMFQVCESPFFTPDNRDMYSYNLFWQGSHGLFSALYSVNMVEYRPGRFINYLALGNKFTLGNVSLELDLMNRGAAHQTFFLKDVSVMGELSWRPARRWNLFGKATYDVNHSGNDADACVMDGTELTMVGGGCEYFPLVTDRQALRLHLNCFYSWGRNANLGNVMQDKTVLLDLGIKWNIDLLRLARR